MKRCTTPTDAQSARMTANQMRAGRLLPPLKKALARSRNFLSSRRWGVLLGGMPGGLEPLGHSGASPQAKCLTPSPPAEIKAAPHRAEALSQSNSHELRPPTQDPQEERRQNRRSRAFRDRWPAAARARVGAAQLSATGPAPQAPSPPSLRVPLESPPA